MMTPERWQQVKEVLGHALELNPDERAAHLDLECSRDPSLRVEVERLLAAEQRAGTDFLGAAAARSELDPATLAATGSRIGQRIGPYEIAASIGEGGMGTVYRAVRADDQYRKQVAIKLVQGGPDSAFIVSRFKNERQILASLDHPNIARLLDGGTTGDGVPYFVMELIDGQPIDKYCDGKRLSINERLQIFLQVCAAVHYAHQRLIIQRDVKPGNILVATDGIPKLLDFGIAKLLDPGDATGADATLTAFRALTPGYASPEQVSGAPITTASDVYSLGVVLYELLTGYSPYRATSRTPHELARAVCETDPERPSAASPEKLRRALRGDLDNIVLMALRKEPEQRYASVERFAEDIRRHMAHLPVAASKGTVSYRAGKFIARHKAGMVAAAIVALTLIAGIAATLREAHIARAQQARAERRFNDVRSLANSLIFDIHDAIADLPGATRARGLLAQKAVQYLDSLARESAGDVPLQRELATAYERVGEVQDSRGGEHSGHTAEALSSFRRAVQIRESLCASSQANAADRRALATAYTKLAGALADTGDFKAAVDLDNKALDTNKQLSAATPSDFQSQRSLAETYATLGVDLYRAGDLKMAFSTDQQAAALLEPLVAASPSEPDLGFTLARVYLELAKVGPQGDAVHAPESIQKAIAIGERIVSANPGNVRYQMDLSTIYSDLASTQTEVKDFTGALDSQRKALAIRQTLAAADPNDVRASSNLATTLSRLGWTLGRLGNFDEDLKYQNQALTIREKLAAASPENVGLQEAVARSFGNLAKTEVRGGSNEKLPVAQRIRHWQQARLWFEKMEGVYDQLSARGPLSHYAVRDLTTCRENIKDCDAALAKLRPAKSSTSTAHK